MAATSYAPERYAFRFPNSFVNQVWSGRIPPVIGRKVDIKTSGRCGGMVFASLDFYHLGLPVPTLEPQDFAPANVPPNGHPLGKYIYKRQLHSMLTSAHGTQNGLRFLMWSGMDAQTMLTNTKTEEDKVVEALERGDPVVLGLIKATSSGFRSQGVNHQVVCYHYRTTGSGQREFLLYDPNEPFRASSSTPYEVVLRRVEDPEGAEFPYQVRRPRTMDQWRGFFVQQYRPHSPSSRVLKA